MKLSPTTGALMPRSGWSKFVVHDPRVTGTLWRTHDGLSAISDLVDTLLPGADSLAGPTWHLSVSTPLGRRVTADELMRAIRDFEMPGWDEDNHHPGVARHLFCPVDEQHRSACECKLTEQLITDGDYAWTTDATARCRGCSYADLLATLAGLVRPCPLHGST